MLRIITIIFTCIIFLEGCKSPLEKFIFTPLTTEELDEIVKKDKSFLTTYSIIEEKSNKLFKTADSAKYKEITYLRLHNYLSQISNKNINSAITSDAREDWSRIHNRYNNQVDSMIVEWENHLKNNSPESLCSINYFGYNTEKVRVKNKIIENLKIKFKIKALNFNIDSIFASYTLVDSSYFNGTDTTNIYVPYPFEYKRLVRDSIITSIIHTQLPGDTINYQNQLKKGEKILLVKLNSVYAKGVCYNTDSIRNNIPSNILTIIDSRKTTDEFFDENIYRNFIIREYLDPEFPSQEAFVRNSIENYHKTLDTLVYSYIHYNQL